MIPADMREKVNDFLFSFPDSQCLCIIDGASVPGLLEALKRNRSEYSCLFSGKLGNDLANVAPYLIKLHKNSPLTDWLLDGWGRHYGIYCILDNTVSLDELRSHFRDIQTARDPDGHTLFFRFYDPRVLSIYLPTCNLSETRQVFGPVKLFVCEGKDENSVQRYWPGSGGVEFKQSSYQAG